MTVNTPLKRSLGLVSVTFYGLGAILGAGIYVLIGEVVAIAGYFAPLSFLLAAVIALFSAFSYADLGSRFPRSAGEAVYVEEAFHRRRLTQLIGLMVVLTGVVSAATMTTGIIGYVQLFVEWPDASIIFCFIGFVGAVAIWGIKESSLMVMLITILEIGGLFYIIYISSDAMMTFPTEQLRAGSVTDLSTLSGILLGGFLAFYAYIGFEDMVNIAEEIRRPERVLPIAILLALVISTLMYMAVSYAALSVLRPDHLGNSSAPLADVVVAKGLSSTWISLISIIAVINGAIVQLIMASRVIYGMARTQLLPTVLARVSVITATPIIATLCCITVTLLLALSFPLALLAQATSVVVLCIFTVVNVALIRINRLYPEDERRRYPVWIPYIGALLSIAMLLVKVVDLI